MKKTTLILLAILLAVCGSAQDKTPDKAQSAEGGGSSGSPPPFNRHNISVYGIGGISTMLYSTTFGGNSDIGFGGGGGLGYGVNFIPQLGIYIGVEAMVLQGGINSNFSETYGNTGINFGGKLAAAQSALYVQAPLLLQTQLTINDNYQFCLAAGIKVGYALPQVLGQSSTSITGNVTIPDASSSPFSFDESINNNLSLSQLNLAFTADIGIRRKIIDQLYLYAGGYVDYGVMDIRKPNAANKNLINATSESIGNGGITGINDFFSSSYIKDKTKTFAFGFKLRFDIDVAQVHYHAQKRREARREARREERRRKREEEEKTKAPEGEGRLVVSVRDALSQRILPSSVNISNRVNLKGENHDSILTEVDKNVHRIRIKSKGDYAALLNVEVPEDLKKIVLADAPAADSAVLPPAAPPAKSKTDPPMEKGSGRIRLMIRDRDTEKLLRASVKVLDSKSLLFVDVLAQLNDDGSYSITLPSEFSGYLTFHIGGRTAASYMDRDKNKNDEDAEGEGRGKSGKPKSKTGKGGKPRRTPRMTADDRAVASGAPYPPMQDGRTYVVTSSSAGGQGGSVGRLVDYLSSAFSDFTLRIRRVVVGNQVRHQVEIQAVQ